MDLDVFKDRSKLLTLVLFFVFLLRFLVNLLTKLEVHPPYRIRDSELLTLLTHLLSELRQYILGRHRREEAVCALVRSIKVLKCQQNRVWVISLVLSKLRIVNPTVDLVVHGISTASLALDMSLHGLLAVLLLSCDLFVCLMARGELLSDLLGGGEFTALKPGVCNDIRDGEALVRVEVQHGGDKVLELLSEEVVGFAV